MEKRAVVEAGRTPSVVSGAPSDFVKNGVALCKGEKDSITPEEKSLAKKMSALYNSGNDAAENN